MKTSLVLTLAGLSSAAPAVVTKIVFENSIETDIIPNFPKATATGLSLFPTWWPSRRVEAVTDADSSDEEVEITASAGSTSITTSSAHILPAIDASSPENDTESLDEDLDWFQANPYYSRYAHQESNAPYPYELVVEDYNMTAIHQAIATYGHDEYDASVCANRCNEHRACDAFAIYIEREPSCTNCSDPEANDVYKCDLYNTYLQRPDVRKESQQQQVQGQTITRAVRAYNGYNRTQRTVTKTATSTRTVAVSGEVSVAYRTRTVTTTARPATTTVHHTMSSGRNSTVTRSAPASTRTVTSIKPTATATVIRTSTKSGSGSLTTVTKTSTKSTATLTSTKSGSAKPTTVTKTSTKSTATVTETATKSTATVTKISTRSSSAKPTTVTKTSTKTSSARPTTVTKTSTKSTATVTTTSTKPTTKTRTAIVSSVKTTTASPPTKTKTAMFTSTKVIKPTTITKTRSRTFVVSATAEAGDESSDEE